MEYEEGLAMMEEDDDMSEDEEVRRTRPALQHAPRLRSSDK